jgi:CMP-2-keto-3-deoxyoctulosonic acid synthetase
MTDRRYTALVLAASRGNLDPLAQAGGVSHKTFIDIAGRPMLERVVRSVVESGRVGRVVISIEQASTEEARRILAGIEGADAFEFVASRENIGTSVIAAASDPTLLPMIITTGDNALHTAELVRSFCDSLDTVATDAALGVTRAELILEKYPDGYRAFHRFADGAFSSCNLYAFLRPQAVAGARIFNSGGQFGKKPKRLIGAFGLVAFLLYKSRWLKLETFLRLLSRGLKISVAAVFIPFAEGPIDVDRMQDWKLAEEIIARREAA